MQLLLTHCRELDTIGYIGKTYLNFNINKEVTMKDSTFSIFVSALCGSVDSDALSQGLGSGGGRVGALQRERERERERVDLRGSASL